MKTSTLTMASLTLVGGMLLLPASGNADEMLARENAAKTVSMEFVKKLGYELKQELKKNGPDSAITVCRDVAPKINSEVARLNGWRVARVTDKPRNPMLGMTDEWESRVLQDFKQRAAKGEKYADMVHGETVTENGKQYYRFMKPIPTAEICTVCHGSPDQIPESVKAGLAIEYPHDKATGYRPGELRGAISIKQPMDEPLSTGWDFSQQPLGMTAISE